MNFVKKRVSNKNNNVDEFESRTVNLILLIVISVRTLINGIGNKRTCNKIDFN